MAGSVLQTLTGPALKPVQEVVMPPLLILPRRLRPLFWSHVNKDGPTQPHMDTPCWLWTAGLFQSGYGQFASGGPGLKRAHRVSWGLAPGHQHPGVLLVCHACDVRACVNPAHLFLGTHRDNATDRNTKGREAHQCGSLQGSAVLTEADVFEIRRIGRSVPHHVLATRYGVRASTINRILLRKRWSHI